MVLPDVVVPVAAATVSCMLLLLPPPSAAEGLLLAWPVCLDFTPSLGAGPLVEVAGARTVGYI